MTRMRFRTDNSHIAERKRLGDTYEVAHVESWATREVWDATPAAEPGDTWRTRWAVTIEQKAQGLTEGPIAGYAIACIKCREVHRWTSALNCEPKIPWSTSWVDDEGVSRTSSRTHCTHSGKGSCWVWTGSAEENLLNASPSLHSLIDKGGCGYHGFLTNGEIT